MNPPVFELVVATVHWTVAIKVFKSWPGQQKRHTPKGVCLFLLLVYTLDVTFFSPIILENLKNASTFVRKFRH